MPSRYTTEYTESKFWRNMRAADNIGFYMEMNNPDNKMQWGIEQHHETRMDELVHFFSGDIKTKYEALGDDTKAKLIDERFESVPQSADDFQAYLLEIGG